MNDGEIQRRTSYYRGLEREWTDSLYELDQLATYQLLAAGDMAGVTGDRANALMDAALHLWAWAGELRRTLDRIDQLTNDRSMFGKSNRDDITALLVEPHIELRRSEIPSMTPPHLHAHLSPSPVDPAIVPVTIDTLISLYSSIYEPVRATVEAVDGVWRDLLPRIEAGEVSLATAEEVARRVGIDLPEIRHARQRLDAVKSATSDDPLALAENVGRDLDDLVARAARAAASAERAHSTIEDGVSVAAERLAHLRVLRARAAAAYSEAQAKVVTSPESPLVPVPSTSVIDGPNGLAERAHAFVDDDQPWTQRRSELDRWQSIASRLETQLERALATNRKLLEDRDEMRGLLRAYRVKADLIADLPSEVDELGHDAHHELYTSPSDLSVARRLIEEFSNALTIYGGGS